MTAFGLLHDQHGSGMLLVAWDALWVRTVHDSSWIVMLSTIDDTCNGNYFFAVFHGFSASDINQGHYNVTSTPSTTLTSGLGGFEGASNTFVTSI